MIKVILFDCDGLIIRHEKYFSQRLAEQRGLPSAGENERQKPFFKGVFLECETGKKDLKVELAKVLDIWGWTKSVEELMDFWFSGEAQIVPEMRDYIISLRANGVQCYLSTNNEKYRTDYLWNTIGLKNIFDSRYSSCDIGYLKKDRNFWQKAYKNFSEIKKSEIFVWDDDQANVDAAKAFGFNAEFFGSLEHFKQRMDQLVPFPSLQGRG